jgi:hypothetical protein
MESVRLLVTEWRYIYITTETPQLHPSTGEYLSPPSRGETMPARFALRFNLIAVLHNLELKIIH